MEFNFVNNVEDILTKDLVEKILKLFSELQEKDSALVVLLVEYLIKRFCCESGNAFKKEFSTISKCTQTECDLSQKHKGWDMKDIGNEVKQVAEQCMNQSGLNYDGKSGTYYNSEEGYYYIPDYKLYYYPRLSAYYYYDEVTDTLKFHSSVAIGETTAMETNQTETSSNEAKGNINMENDENQTKVNLKNICRSPRKHYKEKEEGELSSSDDEGHEAIAVKDDSGSTKVIFESGPKAFAPDHSKHNAPCMRMIIVKTTLDNYNAGTLFLVTRDGGTLGREGLHHEILLPDCNISKEHLKLQYVYKGDAEQRYAYEVIDLGSRNGTWVNGKRLSGPNKKSKPEEIYHGTILTVGSTTFLCHIHKGLDSCSECQTVDTPLIKEVSSKENNLSSKQQHHKQMLQMKQKYQLYCTSVEDALPDGYVDRAKVRRDTVGSSHDSEKTEVASVDMPVNKKNKGYNLLSKMGWQEGSGLGKNNSTSLQEPIYVEPKVGKAGFGA